MTRRYLIAFIVTALLPFSLLASDTTRPENEEVDQPSSAQESEASTIIPPGGITVSTQPITPITIVPEKKLYDQALEELALAQGLWKKGRAEAASDVALQAYDDLLSVHMSRRNKKERKKLRSDRHAAATVYIDSSLAYLEDFVSAAGHTSHAIEEGHSRLGDLRDVAMNYPELNKKLNKALEPYAVKSSSPAPVSAAVSTVPVASIAVSSH